MLVTQEKLKALLEYDPDTGVFRWLKPMSAKAQPGAVAGSMGGGGKLYIGIEQRTTGIKGIFPTRAGKWAAQIAKDNKVHCLGTYETKEDAGDAYKKAAVNLHGEFAKF